MLRGKNADPFLWAGFIFQGGWNREIPEAPEEGGGGRKPREIR